MTASAYSYQVILYTLLSQAFVAIRAVVDLERVTRAILITQAAFMAVYRKAGVALGFPGGRSHIAFIVAFVHRTLICAGSLPSLARTRPAPPIHTSPRLTGPCLVSTRLAPPIQAVPRLALNWSPVSGGGSLPGHALASHAVPRRTPPRRTQSRLDMPHPAAPGLALKQRNQPAYLPTWSLLLKDAPAKWQIDRPMPANMKIAGRTSFSTASISHPLLNVNREF